MGGGTEMVVNCDMVIASEKASFGFPEPKVGVAAAQGAIPRMVRIAGHQVRTLSLRQHPTKSAFTNVGDSREQLKYC